MRRLPLRSPPRVRGKVFFFTGASFCAIFFLEPSGNLLLEPSGSSWVPPDGSIFVFAIGSPPRVRGKGVQSCNERVAVGITPAYAGKRLQNDKGNIYGRDHPRVCGEKRTTAGRSSGACAATSNAIGMVTSALYRSAMSYTKEHSCPTCTNPSPGAHPSATMTAWASPYRQACTVGHTGAGAEQQHRNARHIIHGCFLRAGWSSGQGRRLCRGQCPDTASPGTLPGRSPAGCPHRSPPAM